MENLTEKSCREFASLLASNSAVPGGGGASALAAALGISLCSMMGNFTSGKKKYAAVQQDMERILAEGEALRARLLSLVEEDALAFEPLSKAYAIPKDDPAREAALEEAGKNACAAPMAIIQCCGTAILLLEEVAEKGNPMLLSDAGCGANFCKAAMESAALNVYINTASLRDRSYAQELEKQVECMLQAYVPKAEKIAAAVLQAIRK